MPYSLVDLLEGAAVMADEFAKMGERAGVDQAKADELWQAGIEYRAAAAACRAQEGRTDRERQCATHGCEAPASWEGWYKVRDVSGNLTGVAVRAQVCDEHTRVLSAGKEMDAESEEPPDDTA